MIKRTWTPVLLAATAIGLMACNQKSKSADAPAPKPAVATVNGKAISGDAFEIWVKAQTNKKPEDLSPEQRKQLLESLENLYVSAAEGEKQKLAEAPEVAARIELERYNTLANTLFEKYVKSKPPTDEDLKAEYDKQVAAMPKEEFHASHILVKDEATAKDAIAQLGKGAKFADLAKKLSMDPGSSKNGGDLNWFTPDKMVAPFSEAVAKLQKGEYTKTPVQTQFGWHVIKLEESRPVTPPAFEQVKDRLAPMLQQHMVHDYIESLRKSAKIDEVAPKADDKAAAKGEAKPEAKSEAKN
jgi:peptidyl-prolyl cis-trans isomerase C